MTNILSWRTKLFLLLGPPTRSHFPGFITCYHVLTLWATRVLSIWPTSAIAVWKQSPEMYKHMGVLCPNKTSKNLAVVCQFLDESTRIKGGLYRNLKDRQEPTGGPLGITEPLQFHVGIGRSSRSILGRGVTSWRKCSSGDQAHTFHYRATGSFCPFLRDVSS